MNRARSDDLVALRDAYISRVNTVLGQGREDLADELAEAYETDRLVLVGPTDKGRDRDRTVPQRRAA